MDPSLKETKKEMFTSLVVFQAGIVMNDMRMLIRDYPADIFKLKILNINAECVMAEIVRRGVFKVKLISYFIRAIKLKFYKFIFS